MVKKRIIKESKQFLKESEDKTKWVSLDEFEKQMIKMVNDFYDKNGI